MEQNTPDAGDPVGEIKRERGVGAQNRYGRRGRDQCGGVSASLTNPSNPSTALQAQTAGTGRAIEATIDNTSNASPAVSATTNGTGAGVSASTTGTGPALAVDGIATFSRSGLATVAGTSKTLAQTVTITGVALTSSSLILATPQGVVPAIAIVQGVVPDVSGSSFVIHLNKAIEVSLNIAWFVVG